VFNDNIKITGLKISNKDNIIFHEKDKEKDILVDEIRIQLEKEKLNNQRLIKQIQELEENIKFKNYENLLKTRQLIPNLVLEVENIYANKLKDYKE